MTPAARPGLRRRGLAAADPPRAGEATLVTAALVLLVGLLATRLVMRLGQAIEARGERVHLAEDAGSGSAGDVQEPDRAPARGQAKGRGGGQESGDEQDPGNAEEWSDGQESGAVQQSGDSRESSDSDDGPAQGGPGVGSGDPHRTAEAAPSPSARELPVIPELPSDDALLPNPPPVGVLGGGTDLGSVPATPESGRRTRLVGIE